MFENVASISVWGTQPKFCWQLIALTISCLHFGVVGSQGDELDGVTLQRRVEERVSSFATVDISWRARTHYTRADGRRLSSSPFGNETSDTIGKFPATVEWESHLLCAGNKLRLEHARPVWSFGNSRFETPPHLLVFDGKLAKSLATYADNSFANQGIIRAEPLYELGDGDFMQVLWHFRAFTYPGMLAEMFSTEALVSRERLDGTDAIKLERNSRRTDGSTYEQAIWLDPDADYAVRRFAIIVNGRVKQDSRIEHSRHATGHFVPARWIYESYESDGNLLRSMTAEMVQVAVNGNLDNSTFEYEFPTGTVISDQRTGKERRLLVGASGREFEVTSAQTAAARSATDLLDSLLRAEHQRWNWFSISIAAILTCTGTAVAFVALRRRRKAD